MKASSITYLQYIYKIKIKKRERLRKKFIYVKEVELLR